MILSNLLTGPKELLSDIRSPQFIAALIQGLIIGSLAIVWELSVANFIFSGDLSPFAARASGLCLFGGGIFCLITGLFSSFRTLVSGSADTSVAILSIIAIAIVAALPNAPAEVLFATVVASMISSAWLTALFFWLIGIFKISNFTRFFPFPVIGGFLAGNGFVLACGSFGVMANLSLTWENLPQLLTFDFFIHWAPGVIFAFCVFAVMRFKSHYLVLPISLLVGIFLFFSVFYSLGIPLEQLRHDGWLPAQKLSGQLWPSFTLATSKLIDWPTLFSQLPHILTICLLSLIGMVLNINGVELGARQDIELDRELKVEAAGNLICGLGGGISGHATLSWSLLGPQSGIRSRVIPVVVALVCLSVLFVGADVINFMPKTLLGGLLFLMGLWFVDEWIFTGWRRFALPDFLIVLSIVLAIANLGFLAGVGVGLGLTIIIFLVRFTRIPVIQSTETLATRHSIQQRSVPDRILIERTGQECIVLTLSGYLFFGSTYYVGRKAKELFEQKTPLDSIILDLTQIQGFDISAMNTLQRIAQQSLSRSVRIVLASPPAGLIALTQRNASAEAMQQLDFFDSMDDALEACEEHLLFRYKNVLNENSEESFEVRDNLFAAAVDDLDAQLQEQERFELLLEQMDSYCVQKTVAGGDVLLEQGQRQDSIVFILWGTISLLITDEGGEQKKLASMGPGKIIASKAAWGPWLAGYTAQAEHQSMVAMMSNKAIQTMETEAPEVALGFYKYMAETFVADNERSKKHDR
jgi:SulP family sulfate permease